MPERSQFDSLVHNHPGRRETITRLIACNSQPLYRLCQGFTKHWGQAYDLAISLLESPLIPRTPENKPREEWES